MQQRKYFLSMMLVLCVLFTTNNKILAQGEQDTVFLPLVLTSNNLSDSPPSENEEILYQNKKNQIEETLASDLTKTTSIEYSNLRFTWIKEDDNWIYGYVLASVESTQPADSYTFLVKKGLDSIDVAYMYTEKFDVWVDELPEFIISPDERKFFYSSTKFALVSGISLDSATSLPPLSFPWREGFAWRFTSGPHHRLGQGHNEKPWSGIDFGVPYSSDGKTVLDDIVTTAIHGSVIVNSIEPNCSITIGLEGGWQIRYLHITNITVSPHQSLERGIPIAKVNLVNPCGLSSGPHLHIDLLHNGKYVDFNNHYMGGWQIKEGSSPYQGSLSLSLLLKLNAQTARSGNLASYVMNQGAIGDDWFGNFTMPQKHSSGVTICNNRDCYLANHGMHLDPTTQRDVLKMYIAKGYKVEFTANASLATAATSANSPTYSCLDFDVIDLPNYNFQGTETSIRDNSTVITVLEGSCNPSDRPVRKGSTSPDPQNPETGEETQPNYGCSNQTTGVKFFSNGGSCFYMTAGKASLPFSPSRIEVLDANRKYDITICNANGRCDEFNKSGSIDHSSVSRPFTRAEVAPQGLVSTDTIAACKTSTGRRLEFGTMQAGTRYFTDRSYTIKNVDKHELIGMRFLKTPNDDKGNADPEYLACDIKKPTEIIIGIDRRYKNLPGWMKTPSYTYINREIGVTDDDQQNFQLFYCTQAAGYKLRLGGPMSDGAVGIKSNYIVIFKEGDPSKAIDCSAMFNVPPDLPVLSEVESTQPIYSAPLLQWKMSDRNSVDTLKSYVRIWKDDLLLSTIDWLPTGVTQWVPLWNESGNYKAQVVVRDKAGMEVFSNLITYTISPSINACLAVIN